MAGASFDIKEAQPILPLDRCRSGSLPSLRSEMSFLTVTGEGIGESPLMKKRGSTPHLLEGTAGDGDAPQLTDDASAMGEEWLKFLDKAKQTASWTAELRKRTTQWHRMFNIHYRPKPRADDSLGLQGQALWTGEPHVTKKHGRISKTPSPSRADREPMPKKLREASSARPETSSSRDHGKRGRDPKKYPASSQREVKSIPNKTRAFSTNPSHSLEVKGSPLPLPVKRSISHSGEGSGVVVIVDPAPIELQIDDTDECSSADRRETKGE
ncbi:Hypp2531 [Branchiostoma lanceolatum]|uniref:Hypp2531 protein n=1 Tax=Branchiostoma lanceolatum TaxID=7740 RepID=A0A8J9ZU94_BRALA|nr:Hypp2531 [Branchiostoma lanceolatum]